MLASVAQHLPQCFSDEPRYIQQMRWTLAPWVPLIAVSFAMIGVIVHVNASSLPAMPYGRTLHEVDTRLTVDADSALTIPVGGDRLVPFRSFVRLTIGVLTPRPGSDVTEHAHFQLEGDGRIIDEVDNNVFSVIIQETQEADLQVHVLNEHARPLELEVFGFVTRPPNVLERFLPFMPWLFLAWFLASLWALLVLLLRNIPSAVKST